MSDAVRPLCAGRMCRRRIVLVAPAQDGRHVLLVLEGQPLRVTHQMTLTEPPRSLSERALLAESAQ